MPPAQVNYKEKGSYITLDGMKICTSDGIRSHSQLGLTQTIDKTGPRNATSAILVVFDIFGYCPQTLQVYLFPAISSQSEERARRRGVTKPHSQGADILAHADDSSHQYQVFMPDFFYGKPADPAWVPPDTPEKAQKLGEFIKGPASAATNVPKIPSLVRELTKKSGGTIQRWGALGLCWGGKVGPFHRLPSRTRLESNRKARSCDAVTELTKRRARRSLYCPRDTIPCSRPFPQRIRVWWIRKTRRN